MTNKLKTAVVGVGRWGVHWLRNVLENPRMELSAVVDPSLERLGTIKRLYNLDESVILISQWQELQELLDLDAVIIATPATTHYELIKDALSWGNHVLAEKPLTLNPEECETLCQLAQKQQRQLMIDHTYLFHPAVERGQEIIQAGKIGDLRYGYATRTHLGPVRQDVDALWDLAIHDIAIFNCWLGELPHLLRATGSVWLQPELSDLVWVEMIYPSGFQTNIHLCWLNPDKQRRLGMVGSNGSLIFDEMSPDAPLTLINGEFEIQDRKYIPVNQNRENIEIPTAEPLKQVCDRFINCVRENKPDSKSNGWVGKELTSILSALTDSLQQGGKPTFLKEKHD
ncbi:MAG: Gfo/Idh/MocA family oxidoreductase [Cyanobacteria bacterium P01_A01_bin.84]